MRTPWLIALVVIILSAVYSLSAESIYITVYNQNLGLVREIREIEFKKGLQDISFVEIPAQINPTSVHFKSFNNDESISLLEQNYEYDLVGTSKLLEKYIDHEIKLVTIQEKSVFWGILMSVDNISVIITGKDGTVYSINRDEILSVEFPSLPEGLITKPTLVMKVSSEAAGTKSVEISYLTGGINWQADYVAVVNEGDTDLTLEGWVTITNQSGGEFKNANLKLVAGDVHRTPTYIRDGFRASLSMEAKAAPSFSEKEFFEYHLYSLQRQTTIRQNEIKQISLFPIAETRVEKLFEFDHTRNSKQVMVKLEFINSKQAGLGMPLPEGTIRVYKADSDRSLQFIGEDSIEHTPRDEKVKVFLGFAFDIAAERIVKDHSRISERVSENIVQLKFRNHKKEPVNIKVYEPFTGDWEIVKCNVDYKKKDANTAEFNIEVPAGEEKSIEFDVRIKI